MTTYFGLAFSLSMLEFPATVTVVEEDMAKAKEEVEGAVSALNPTHTATIAAFQSRFGISPEIPKQAPSISLQEGDEILVLQVFGLPRLGGDRKEYTPEEIGGAKFKLLRVSVG